MAENLERAKRKRATIRMLSTKLLQKIERNLEAEEINLTELHEILEQLTLKEGLLKELDKEIEDITVDFDDLELELIGSQDYQEKIATWKYRARVHTQENTRAVEAIRSNNNLSRSSGQGSVKLPKLTIAKFYGEVSNWQEFWSQYDAAIHKNEVLTKIDKFNYLRSLLGGIASNSISGISLSNENYDIAIKLLTDRFGRKDLVINAHMNKLLNITPVKSATDITALRRLYDKCEVQVRSLESLGILTGTYGSLLCPILLKMIPENLVLEFSRRRKNDENWDARELIEFIKMEVECRERAAMIYSYDEEKQEPTSGGARQWYRQSNKDQWLRRDIQPFKKRLSSASALTTTCKNRCVFCGNNGDHNSEQCKEWTLEDKRQLLKRQGRCFLCLGVKHVARFCKAKMEPCNCGRRHHRSLCDQVVRTENTSENKSDIVEPVVTSVSHCKKEPEPRNKILLQTAVASIKGRFKSKKIRCLLDGGSQRTFIDEGLSRKLNLPVVGEESLTIHAFGTQGTTIVKRRRVKIKLQNAKDERKNIEIEALEAPQICSAYIHAPEEQLGQLSKGFELQLADNVLKNKAEMKISILIGADFYWRIVTGEIRRLNGTLVALNTILGWTIHGPTSTLGLSTERSSVRVMKVLTEETEVEEISKTLKGFWDLDTLGITDEKDLTSVSRRDEIMENFVSTLKIKNNRYQVKLLWKDSTPALPNNRKIAEGRLNKLVKRFQQDQGFYESYMKVIDEYKEKKIVEAVNVGSSELGEKTYYMPHQAVMRLDKTTTRLRVVFDASAHEKGAPSLNDCLLPGPNLNPEILSLLIKFRLHKVAMIADIEKAFLQIELDPEDRDSVRFLWLKGNLEPEKETQYQELRMTRVLFGVTSSPFLLAATIKNHIKKYEYLYPEAFRMLEECLYVDDLISGAEDEEQASRIRTEIKLIFEQASMNIRKWQTNSKTLLEKWNKVSENERGDEMRSINESSGITKVLGLAWRIMDDTFTFDASNLLRFLVKRECTKRSILQAAGRIYDPIGFITPFTVRIKQLFQELWELGVRWDDPLPERVKKKWNQWCDELPLLSTIRIPRHYFSCTRINEIYNAQLHCFTDASEKAYGAVVYLRVTNIRGEPFIVFVSSKSRIAPLKRLSLPRLELMATLIGTRLSSHIQETLKDKLKVVPFFWTDSMIAVYWIRSSTKQWKPFVQNRVDEIHKRADPSSWFHCPGKQNPADILTRGGSVEALTEQGLWWNGPQWLKTERDQWPKTIMENKITSDAEKEKRKEFKIVAQLNCIQVEQTKALFDIRKYSRLSRLLRITAWVKRFLYNCRHANQKRSGTLTTEEVWNATIYWIRHVQEEAFKKEILSLKMKSTISNTSKIYLMNPKLDDDNILRLGGRLQGAEFTFEQKHPILLPSKVFFSDLVIYHNHISIGHAGVAETLAQIRERYWIIKGRQRVKTIIKNCFLCKKLSVQPMSQEMAPLPIERIKEAFPFEVTGVDFAGPLYIRKEDKVGKAYIALFTCAVTRAVHLELVSDMSTETFLLAFRRFIGRRGICKTMISDNAKTFKKAEREFKELWSRLKGSALQEFFCNNSITWKFIVERAAWWGGFWERLVRSVKNCLKKILGRALLHYQEMETALIEIEAILNSRPITFTYNDVRETSPLTPGHFLIGRRLMALPSTTETDINIRSTKNELTKRYRYRQKLIENFWKRWRENYIMDLRTAHQVNPNFKASEIKKNTVVLIYDNKQPRLFWKLGIVKQVHLGRDGRVRACDVRISSGTTIKRPVQLLCPLELE